MSKANVERINEILTAARSDGRLATCQDKNLRRACGRLVESGKLVMPYQGLFAEKAYWDELEMRQQAKCMIKSLARMHPSWVFCSHSAAVLHGLEVSTSKLKHVHVVGTREPCGIVRFHNNRHAETAMVDGVAVTTLERTVCDCVRANGFRYGLATVDSALRTSQVSPEEFRDRLERVCKAINNGQFVLDVFDYGDGRSENGGESYARAVMIENGVQLPDLQVELYDEVDKRTYRIDYGWRLKKAYVAGELDGAEKYKRIAKERGMSVVDVIRVERLRESRCRNKGMLFARFTFAQAVAGQPLLSILDACGVPRIEGANAIPAMRETG